MGWGALGSKGCPGPQTLGAVPGPVGEGEDWATPPHFETRENEGAMQKRTTCREIPIAGKRAIDPATLSKWESDLCQDPKVLQQHRLLLIGECRRLRALRSLAIAEIRLLRRALDIDS